jgi:hypothetical protein
MSCRRSLMCLLVFVLGSNAWAGGYEVWLVDQSNSFGKSYGGRIIVFDGKQAARGGGDGDDDSGPSDPAQEVIDLGAGTADLCLARTGAFPVRPHMVVFNSTETHAALSFVASGHVVFFDAKTRQPLECFRMQPGAGGARQAHAVWPTNDDQYMLVANQNGKLFERIRTDYATNTFTYEPAASLNLATCTTPNGFPCQDPVLRPDNAPICPFTASPGVPAFVTLRGGGMLLVDPYTTPISIVAEYDRATIAGNGCGLIEARGWVYFNAGGGTANNLDQFSVYRLPRSGFSPLNPPNTPVVQLIYNDEDHHRDAHGVATSKHERFVWMYDRAANVAEVFDGHSGAHLSTVPITHPATTDASPDLVALSPNGVLHFVSLRGPNPLSGDPHSSTGDVPGLGIVRLTEAGRNGRLEKVIPITNRDAAGIERADAHGIRIRRK